MTKKKKVSIIILTWNGLKDTLEVLDYVAKQKIDGYEMETIVADNGSTDGTIKKLRDFTLPNMDFRFIENSENLGFAGGNNVAIKNAYKRGADFIVLLNNDIEFPEDFIVKLINEMEKDDKIGLLAPKMYFGKGFEFHKDRYKKSELGHVIWYAGGIIDWKNVYSSHKGVDEVDKGQFNKKEETDFVNGAAVVIRRGVVKDIGYLDEDLYLYWEDADYSERARRAGWKVVYTPKTHMWHKVSAATGGSGSPSNDYFLTRNRLLFGLRYAKLRTKIALFKDSIRLLLKGRLWQKIGVIDFYLGRFGKGSWGLRRKRK